MIQNILLISRDRLTLNCIGDALRARTLLIAQTGEKALELIKEKNIDLVVLDLNLKQPPGIVIYQEIRRLMPTAPLITISDTKEGDLTKPIDAKMLLERIDKTRQETFSIIANSPSMCKILKDVEKLAKSGASVFISGESGTGKEVIAKAIHRHSLRKTAPFIRVNCAALPETLIESELFGHEKGSFTGAHARRLGRFELADKGTLLLDEVTEIPLAIQSKLLRAIQEQEFERIGGMKSITVDTRIIATSNRDMSEAIQDKIFREDLYYRLNVLPIYLPPLRERVEDILPLAHHFLQKTAPQKTLTPSAEQKLLSYSWPGNIRELGNVIEHAAIMSTENVIDAQDMILKHIPKTCPVQILDEMHKQITIKEMEKMLIAQTLKTHQGNRTRTAAALGISIRTLRNKLKIYPELSPGQ